MVALGQSEKRLLWHPRQDNRFVVGGGSQITLYEWAPDDHEIRHVTSQHDLQFMKCFAWSPDSVFDDLIAVGLSTGRVDLIRLEAHKSAGRNNVLSTGPTVSLPVRNSRSCHTLAFCSVEPNYLAVGLDKVRGDSSLIIWDIQSASALLSVSTPHPDSTINGTLTRPSRSQHQIPRVDTGPRSDNRILQQHAPAETVSSVAFLPQTSNLLVAGISHRWLRLFDLRAASPSTTNVASKVQGIATDPFDAHRIACFGDGIVSVFDARRLTSPLLTFTEKDALADGARIRSATNSHYTTIEFSSVRRGMLGTLEKDATYVRFWDLTRTQHISWDGSSDGESIRDVSRSRTSRMSWATLPWTGGSSSIQSQLSYKESETHSIEYHLVLSETRKTKHFSRSLASFALVPSPEIHPFTSNVMVVNKEGDLELYAVHDAPKHLVWSARGDLAVTASQTLKILPGFNPADMLTGPGDPVLDQGLPPLVSSARRGRNKSRNPSSSGQGDDEGLALASDSLLSANLAATRPRLSQSYSQASLRKYAAKEDGGQKGTLTSGNNIFQANAQNLGSRNHIRHRHKNHPGGKDRISRAFDSVVENDISMTMRRRVIAGYGIGDPQQNVVTIRNTSNHMDDTERSLSVLWTWLSQSRDLLCQPTPKLHGYNFSCKGLIGIWDGFPPSEVPPSGISSPSNSDGFLGADAALSRHERRKARRSRSPADHSQSDFHTALTGLTLRRDPGMSTWKPTIPTSKLEARRVSLLLCEWSVRDEDLANKVKRWEKENKYSRAACWLVFTKQYSKAVDLLMRSKDQSHHMMSGTLAALIASTSPTSNFELREHCEHLIVRLQDPYFRAMLTHLTLGDWDEVLEEEALPFKERLAIAFQFLEDRDLSSYLRRMVDKSCARGDIEGLILTGLTKPGIDILQSYVDRTGDVQTAAILSAHACPAKFADARADRWLEAYRDLLDGFKLFHHRVGFDIERGRILQDAIVNDNLTPFEWAPGQILIKCNYCNKPINSPGVGTAHKGRADACPHCGRGLPRCAVCLMALSIVQDVTREAELAHPPFRDTIDDAIVICQTCRHGGHASHILGWFFGEDNVQLHGTCPVAECDCRCADEF